MCNVNPIPEGMFGYGCLFVMMRADLLMPAEEYKANVAHYASEVRKTRPVEGGPPVRMPYDRSIEARQARIDADEVEISDEVYEKLIGNRRSEQLNGFVTLSRRAVIACCLGMGGQNAYFGAHEYCRILFDYEAMGLRRLKRSRYAVYSTCYRIRLTQRTRACSLRWADQLAHRCWMAPVARERPARRRVQRIK